MSERDYPEREPYFGNRFLRTLTKCAVAMELGTDACWLLTIIVMQEDACRFRRPVLFWNQRLCDLCGWADDRTLSRTRSMLVGAGWLHYQAAPEGSRKPGAYYVTIPAEADGMDDPTEEGSHSTIRPTSDVPRRVGRSGGRSVGRDGGRHGGLFVPSPIPIPNPSAGVAAVANDNATTTAPAATLRVDPVDRKAAAQAMAEGGLFKLLTAFGCTVDKVTRHEWPRAEVTGDLTLHQVAAVLYYRLTERDSIRMPRGFAKARTEFAALPKDIRWQAAEAVCTYLGVQCPARPSAA